MEIDKIKARARSIDWKRVVIIAIAIAVVAVLVVRRNIAVHKDAAVFSDPETTPTMITRDADSFVTDSGYTRYHIEAPVWYIFDEASDPYWRFDSGIYIEQFDRSMQVVATFTCDSARYRSVPQIWEFIGNVRIHNERGDKFLTRLMHYDTRQRKIYSDSFIHIEQAGRIIEGYGFESDENLDEYVVRRPSMILPVKDLAGRPQPDDESPSSTESPQTQQ